MRELLGCFKPLPRLCSGRNTGRCRAGASDKLRRHQRVEGHDLRTCRESPRQEHEIMRAQKACGEAALPSDMRTSVRGLDNAKTPPYSFNSTPPSLSSASAQTRPRTPCQALPSALAESAPWHSRVGGEYGLDMLPPLRTPFAAGTLRDRVAMLLPREPARRPACRRSLTRWLARALV